MDSRLRMCAQRRLDHLLTTFSVQEGLIFVAMSAEELLSGTSTYRLQHRTHSPSASPSPERRRYVRNAERISLREAADFPDVWQTSRRQQDEVRSHIERLRLGIQRTTQQGHALPDEVRSSIERLRLHTQRMTQRMTQQGHALPDDVESRIERLRLRTQRLTQQRHAQAQSENPRSPEPPAESDEDIDFDCDYTASAGISAPTPPPFNVTTTSEEEEESSNDDYPNVETMADRIQREGRWRPSSDDENEDVAPRRNTGARFRQLLQSAQFADDYEMRARRISLGPRYRNILDNTEPIRASRLSRPSKIDAGPVDADRRNVLAPHAKFFIKKNKSKITIKFQPAM